MKSGQQMPDSEKNKKQIKASWSLFFTDIDVDFEPCVNQYLLTCRGLQVPRHPVQVRGREETKTICLPLDYPPA